VTSRSTTSGSPRVVSLVPSATESLLAWGVRPLACTRFCERPELPHVGGTKDPDVAAIVGLAPDLVVMCEEENLRAHHDELVAAGLATFAFCVDTVFDVAPQLAELARRLGLDPPPPEPLPPPRPPRPAGRAFVPIWRKPWMSMSSRTYGSSLLAHLGFTNVCADAQERYPALGEDEVRAARPDVVLAPSEPYPLGERHRAELERFAPAILVDGQDLFWWGVRTPAAVGRLADALASVGGGAPA
jgi:ABC-type Fe3+-hydroxamate transport system substrate-binding protein